MKKLSGFIIALLLISCSKDGVLPTTVSTNSDGGGRTNFTDLSDWGNSKELHPFFTALESHKYRVEVYAGKGVEFGTTSSYNSRILDASGSPMNIGRVTVGTFELNRDSQGHYSSDGVEAGSQLYDLFGNTITPFVFPGTNGNISKYVGEIHLPKVLFLSGISGTSTAKPISRNENMSLSISPDGLNQGLPLAVTVTWDSNVDQQNSNHKYNLVINKFLVNDNGGFRLTADFFQDMPKNAKGVVVSIWRGNAAVDSQDFYVLGYTNTYFPVDLTD